MGVLDEENELLKIGTKFSIGGCEELRVSFISRDFYKFRSMAHATWDVS